jgi:hypothetical protein
MSKSTNSVRLQPWQFRALQNGRTPLPEASRERPWLDPRACSQDAGSQLQNPRSSIDVLSSSGTTNTEKASSGAEVSRNRFLVYQAPRTNVRSKAASMTYRFWSDDDMRSLITLRNTGATWPDVYASYLILIAK